MWAHPVAFLNHWLKGYNPRRVHSPFLLDLMNRTFEQRKVYQDIEVLRTTLKNDKRVIEGIDHGAVMGHNTKNKVRRIARKSLSTKERASFLHGLVKASHVEHVLELGTSLGITSAYLSKAISTNGSLVTIEGNEGVAKIAETTFSILGLKNVELLQGTFNEVLPSLLSEREFDFILVDGDHKYSSAIGIFDTIISCPVLPRMIYFDDIRWSEGMREAWDYIVADPRVTLCVDFFRFGIVFTSPDLANQYLRVRFIH